MTMSQRLGATRRTFRSGHTSVARPRTSIETSDAPVFLEVQRGLRRVDLKFHGPSVSEASSVCQSIRMTVAGSGARAAQPGRS